MAVLYSVYRSHWSYLRQDQAPVDLGRAGSCEEKLRPYDEDAGKASSEMEEVFLYGLDGSSSGRK